MSSYSARGLSPPANHQLPMYPLQQECLESDSSDVCEINENLIFFLLAQCGVRDLEGADLCVGFNGLFICERDSISY